MDECRKEALSQAVRLFEYDDDRNADTVLATAARFANYLRDGTIPTIMTPEGDGNVITLTRKGIE